MESLTWRTSIPTSVLTSSTHSSVWAQTISPIWILGWIWRTTMDVATSENSSTWNNRIPMSNYWLLLVDGISALWNSQIWQQIQRIVATSLEIQWHSWDVTASTDWTLIGNIQIKEVVVQRTYKTSRKCWLTSKKFTINMDICWLLLWVPRQAVLNWATTSLKWSNIWIL